ncbi:metallophosphoesterase, partial [Streptomyces rhizosphaericus]
FQLVGSVSGAEYVQDHKVSVIVQDQIADVGEDFSFVWMADTQYYSESYPHIYEQQVNWIAENQQEHNIEYVFHSGDLVNIHDDFEQWDVADRSMRVLDEAGVPYGVVAGNHDVNNKQRYYDNYSQFFGEDRFEGKSYYGESFQDNRGHYDLISVNGMDFIMVHLGWGIE